MSFDYAVGLVTCLDHVVFKILWICDWCCHQWWGLRIKSKTYEARALK
jgi:hypothetical protein